jgi:hypothetical protein
VQAQFDEGYQYGLKTGVNMSTFRGGNLPEADRRVGWVIGLYVSWQLRSALAIQVEYLFTSRGADLAEPILDFGEIVTGEERWTLTYFEVPVLLKLTLPTGDRVRPAVFGGPSLGVNTASRVEQQTDRGNLQVGFEDETNDIELSLVGGAALDVILFARKFTFEGRVICGLSNIGTFPGDREPKNIGYGAMIGIAF